MANINEKRYPNINEAVAFRIAFAPVICTYGNIAWDEIERTTCSQCGQTKQIADFLATKAECKKDCAILNTTYHYGVSITVHDLLIENFDITEADFRPIRNKSGAVVFYQIAPRHIMMPLQSVNRFRALKPCAKCGSVQYREKKFMNKEGWPYSFISQEALENLCDLNETFEKFDMFRPEWVVSRRVYDFLVERYPRMNFEPIFLK